MQVESINIHKYAHEKSYTAYCKVVDLDLGLELRVDLPEDLKQQIISSVRDVAKTEVASKLGLASQKPLEPLLLTSSDDTITEVVDQATSF